MTEAEPEMGVASGFVDRGVINLFLCGRRKSGAPLDPTGAEILSRRSNVPHSGHRHSTAKSLCHLDFRERLTPWSHGRQAAAASVTACMTLAADWQSKTPTPTKP